MHERHARVEFHLLPRGPICRGWLVLLWPGVVFALEARLIVAGVRCCVGGVCDDFKLGMGVWRDGIVCVFMW